MSKSRDAIEAQRTALSAVSIGTSVQAYDADTAKLDVEQTYTAAQTFGTVAVTGNVDGRDVSVDGAKLDGIEANATADQTGAQIKTAYQAETNAFTDAQFTKLAGVAASANNYVHPNHSGDVVSAADGAMTIQTNAVDIAMLSATGTPSNTTFLRGDNAWVAAGSTSASDLTSGTLPIARIADDAITTDKLANSINTAIDANTAKTGITSSQATAITAALPKAGGTMTGVIAGFESTGIDDNATSTKVTVSDTGVDVTGTVTADGLTVDGRVVVYDTTQTMNGGISTEANAAIINFGLNEGSANRFGGSYTQANQGGMLNFDTRAGQPLFQIYTRAAGTAAATGTASFNINSAGNVGIGVTPEAWQSNYDVLQISSGASLAGSSTNSSRLFLNANTYINTSNQQSYIATDEASQYWQNGGTHLFNVAPSGTADAAISWTTAMTIANSGNVLIGGGVAATGRLYLGAETGTAWSVRANANDYNDGSGSIHLNAQTTASRTLMNFYVTNGAVGSIVTSGSSTSYNTSSDYRLKTDVQPMTGATDRVKLLKPCNFEWISDGTRVDGFLAHEAQEVVPESVVGTKDAMMDEEYEVTAAVVDDEGNETTAAVMGTRSVPDMQGIDQSKLVPLLTATIQELIARIEALEA